MKVTRRTFLGIGAALFGTTATGRALAGDRAGTAPWPSGPALTDAEMAGILYTREEEKLARDVYLTLGDRWGDRVFANIADSEQRHMDAMRTLVESYGLTDPVGEHTIGDFTDSGLQELYDRLIERGSTTRLEALLVGGYIEELDLADLNDLIADTSRADILTVYENLDRGSRNHLRAFARQIERLTGSLYEAQVLPAEEVAVVLDGNVESGGRRGR